MVLIELTFHSFYFVRVWWSCPRRLWPHFQGQFLLSEGLREMKRDKELDGPLTVSRQGQCRLWF